MVSNRLEHIWRVLGDNANILLCTSSSSYSNAILCSAVSYYAKNNQVFMLSHNKKSIDNSFSGDYKQIHISHNIGINPFEFSFAAGPEKQIEFLINSLKASFFHSMDTIAETIFHNLFLDTYKFKGILHNNASSWSKEIPVFSDTVRIVHMLLNLFNDDEKNDTKTIQLFNEHYIDFEKYREFKDELQVVKFFLNLIRENGIFEKKSECLHIGLNHILSNDNEHSINMLFFELFFNKLIIDSTKCRKEIIVIIENVKHFRNELITTILKSSGKYKNIRFIIGIEEPILYKENFNSIICEKVILCSSFIGDEVEKSDIVHLDNKQGNMLLLTTSNDKVKLNIEDINNGGGCN